MFDKRKQQVLSKKDNSKKGSLDKAIQPLIDILNKQDDYFTTSSCAGRISVIGITADSRKDKAGWLYKTHDAADTDKVWDSIQDTDRSLAYWFRMEPAMLHVACRDIEAAFSLLQKVRAAGLKRSGIISKKAAVTVEIVGTERINALAVKQGQLLITKEYLRSLIEEANEKLKQTRHKIKKLEKLI